MFSLHSAALMDSEEGSGYLESDPFIAPTSKVKEFCVIIDQHCMINL